MDSRMVQDKGDCPVCGKTYRKNLKRHLVKVHQWSYPLFGDAPLPPFLRTSSE